MGRLFLISIGLLMFILQLSAQSIDTLKQNTKTQGDSLVKKHSPRKAALMSTIIPGLGQAYNKKFWKIPVIYGGFIGIGYFLSTTQKKYVAYRDAYLYRTDTLQATIDDFPDFSTDNLKTLQEHYHKNRDLLTICFGALYFLNIIDATVDAHLFYFDVSDKLSLNVQPYLENTFQANHSLKGVTLTLKF